MLNFILNILGYYGVNFDEIPSSTCEYVYTNLHSAMKSYEQLGTPDATKTTCKSVLVFGNCDDPARAIFDELRDFLSVIFGSVGKQKQSKLLTLLRNKVLAFTLDRMLFKGETL